MGNIFLWYISIGVGVVLLQFLLSKRHRDGIVKHPLIAIYLIIRWPKSVFAQIDKRRSSVGSLGFSENDKLFYRRWVAANLKRIEKKSAVDHDFVFTTLMTYVGGFEFSNGSPNAHVPGSLSINDAVLFELGCYLISLSDRWMAANARNIRIDATKQFLDKFVAISFEALSQSISETGNLLNSRMSLYGEAFRNGGSEKDIEERLVDLVQFASLKKRPKVDNLDEVELNLVRLFTAVEVHSWVSSFTNAVFQVLKALSDAKRDVKATAKPLPANVKQAFDRMLDLAVTTELPCMTCGILKKSTSPMCKECSDYIASSKQSHLHRCGGCGAGFHTRGADAFVIELKGVSRELCACCLVKLRASGAHDDDGMSLPEGYDDEGQELNKKYLSLSPFEKLKQRRQQAHLARVMAFDSKKNGIVDPPLLFVGSED